MDLTSMLNSKAAAGALPADHQGPGPQPYIKHDPSLHMSEQAETAYDPVGMQKQESHASSSLQSDFRGVKDEAPESSATNLAASVPITTDDLRTFPCSTCSKRFARRSDLARHERIHSGDRPHVCPEPGCGKPFIQRSALTVHMRVHSGEKPHMCERCGKPFSDSSSLARHRRIHSGKRPYQCPFADCQKTFTRRTTLTRHQSHHSGTVEEAAAARQRALESRPPDVQQRTTTNGVLYPDAPAQLSALSGNNTPLTDRYPGPDMSRQPSTSYHPSMDGLPPHLRSAQPYSPRQLSSQSEAPALPSFSTTTGYQHRPSPTSHPILPVLEPPPYHGPRSGGASPHMTGMSHPGVPSSGMMPLPQSSGGWQHPSPHAMSGQGMASDFTMYGDGSSMGGGMAPFQPYPALPPATAQSSPGMGMVPHQSGMPLYMPGNSHMRSQPISDTDRYGLRGPSANGGNIYSGVPPNIGSAHATEPSRRDPGS